MSNTIANFDVKTGVSHDATLDLSGRGCDLQKKNDANHPESVTPIISADIEETSASAPAMTLTTELLAA